MFVRPTSLKAIESALRGGDPRFPHMWNEDLLAQLRELVTSIESPKRTFALRNALQRRTDEDRPTGSFTETLLFQALRNVGINCVRQARIRIIDERGATLGMLFPDLSVPDYLLLLEADSILAHEGAKALNRDLLRQNKLMRDFHLQRFPASRILGDIDQVVIDVQRLLRTLPRSAESRVPRSKCQLHNERICRCRPDPVGP